MTAATFLYNSTLQFPPPLPWRGSGTPRPLLADVRGRLPTQLFHVLAAVVTVAQCPQHNITHSPMPAAGFLHNCTTLKPLFTVASCPTTHNHILADVGRCLPQQMYYGIATVVTVGSCPHPMHHHVLLLTAVAFLPNATLHFPSSLLWRCTNSHPPSATLRRRQCQLPPSSTTVTHPVLDAVVAVPS